jgi:transcriptional regulator with XRE-family HTH domain
MTSPTPHDAPLGRRLRELRDAYGLTQRQVGDQLGSDVLGPGKSLSAALISSWESGKALPSERWLAAYARSFVGSPGHEGVATDESVVSGLLESELAALRRAAAPQFAADVRSASPQPPVTESRFWHFPDGRPICIIGSSLPDDVLACIPYANRLHPNHMPLLRHSDGDAVVELFGHLRAENPRSEVRYKTPDQVVADDLSGHVAVIGGGDLNPFAEWFTGRMELPVLAHGTSEDDVGADPFERASFVVKSEDGSAENRYGPIFDGKLKTTIRRPVGSDMRSVDVVWPNLVYDVALIARQPNPTNCETTATLCYGLYSRGTYGATRVFTDAQIRTSNERYRRARFGYTDAFWMLVRVLCHQQLSVTTTPDLHRDFSRVVEWPSS